MTLRGSTHGGLRAEYRPSTLTQRILVEEMAQHLWLSRRAQDLQDGLIVHQNEFPAEETSRRFALFLRYQPPTTAPSASA